MDLGPRQTSSFRAQIVSGAAWSLATNVGYQLLSICLSIVLMRLLEPAAFGMIAMVTVFTGFAAIFSDLGFTAALVQRQDVGEDHCASVFWLNTAAGGVLSLLFLAAAPLLAGFYRVPQLLPLTALLGANFLLASLSLVHLALLQKRLAFRTIALIDLTALAVGGGAAVALAMRGFHVWSLATQVLLSSLARTVLLVWAGRWRPPLRFAIERVRELVAFSTQTAGFTLANYWIRNADNLLVARLLGKDSLGLYSRAYSIMLFPITVISAKVQSVLFPALSAIQEDRPRVASVYLRAVRAIALCTFPMMTGLLVTADTFVPAVLGPLWLEVVPLVRVFALVGMIESIGTLNGSIYLSQGRTALRLRVLALVGPLAILAIAVGTHWGIRGVAVAYAVYSLAVTVPTMGIPLALVGLGLADVGRVLAGVAACSAFMGAALWGLRHAVPATLPPVPRFALEVGAGALLFVCLAAALRIEAVRDLATVGRELWRQRAASGPGVTDR